MKIALGPVPYYWPKETLLKFYQEVAKTSIDIFYIGETICSKRKTLSFDEWLQLAESLTNAGKEVVLSTLALVEAESEIKTLKHQCHNNHYLVEANDIAAVQLLHGKPFICGPSINIYNEHTLTKLAKLGLCRWVLPVELSRDTLSAIHNCRPNGVATEVIVFGRLPLAYSARCFTARYRNLQKDQCELCCGEDAEGLLLSTQEGLAFLNLNGIQTQSAYIYNLLQVMPQLKAMAIDVIRIIPQLHNTSEIIEVFRNGIDDAESLERGMHKLKNTVNIEFCDGYWYGHAGIDAHQTSAITTIGSDA